MTDTYFDKDGLIFSKHITLHNGNLFLDGQQIYITPEARSVFEYLAANPDLWRSSRLSVSDSGRGMKRAPIFGVPFREGLYAALASPKSHIKALYQRDDWEVIKGHAVVGTLVAHTSSSADLVEFEAWQLLDMTSETFYMHAILNREYRMVVHLDGATIHHSLEEKSFIAKNARKIKGAGYKKHFRIDGSFSIKIAEDLMDLYLPLDDLTDEFLQYVNA